MADEVVGSVTVNVHGDTDPLKDDIRRAALDAGKAIDAGIGKGAAGKSITDNIVSQVSDSEQPAGKEAEKVGRAIANGVDVGSGDIDVTRRINENLKQAEAPLREQAERLGKQLGTTLGANLAEANRDAVAGMRSDVKMKIDIDREKFRADLTDSQRDWVDFGDALGASIDRALAPWWKRLPRRLHEAFDDDRGSVQIGRRAGERMGVNFVAGIGRGVIGAADWVGGKIIGGIGKTLLSAGPQAILYGAGARLAAVLGGGLLSGLTTITQGIAGWASGIVGQVGQAVAGVGAVVAGTIGSAFAGLGATAYSSIAALAPALLGLKLAFAGLEKEQKKALEDRFKEAKKAFSGFGQAVRAELLQPLFDSLKAFEVFVPTLKSFGTALGGAAAGIVKSFTAVMTSGPMIGQVNQFLQSSVGYFKQVGEAAIGIAPSVLSAFNAISPVTRKFFDDISGGLENFSHWLVRISDGGKNSELTTTLDEWYERGKALLSVFSTVAGSVFKIFDVAADVRGDQFLGSLQETADKFSTFIKITSADGRLGDKLGEWYDQGADLAAAFGNLTKIVLLFFDSAGNQASDALSGFRATTERWLQEFEFFRASRQLGGVITEWYVQGKQLLDILGNVGRTVGNILGVAAGNSDTFLTSLQRVTSEWEDWTTSFTGSQTLKDYFEGSQSVLGEVVGLFGDLAGIFTETMTAPADNLKSLFQTIREVWVPAIEGLVDSFRDSGIQDAIFNIVEALGGLDDGGVIGQTFQMLAIALEGIAKALQLMGPFVPAFVTFVAAVKTLALLKLGAKALGLTALAEGIKKVALARLAAAGVSAAGTAAGAAAGTAAGAAAAAGAGAAAGTAATAGATAAAGAATAAGAAGLAASAAALAPLVAAAAVAVGAFVAVNKAIDGAKENVDRFSSASDLTVQQQADGYARSLSTFEKWGTAVKDFATDWHNLIPGVGIANGFQAISDVIGTAATDARNLELIRGGMENYRDEINRLLTQGRFDEAYDRIDQLQRLLKESGGDAGITATLEEFKTAVQNAHVTELSTEIKDLFDAGDWEAGAKAAGDAIAVLAGEDVDLTTLRELRAWAIQLATGILSGNAIEYTGSVDLKALDAEVAKLKEVEDYWKNGKWTEAGEAAKEKLLVGFQKESLGPTLQTNLDEITKTLQTFDPSKGTGGEWTSEGLTLRAKVFAEADHTSINGVKNAIDPLTAKSIKEIYAEPANYDPKTGFLTGEAQTKVVELQLTGIKEAKAQLAEFTGTRNAQRDAEIAAIKKGLVPGSVDYENDIRSAMRHAEEDITAFSVGITAEMKVTSKLDQASFDTAIGIVENTDPTLEISPSLKDLPNIQIEIYDYVRKHPFILPVVPTIIPPTPGSGNANPFGGNPNNPFQHMVVPPSEPEPSMISPGGPSTMGYASAAGPGLLARSGGGDSGVMGSPNYYSNQDKDKISKNVTINNYYPEPERVSDTIAMQMRIARYA